MLRATWILFAAHLRRTLVSKRALLCLLLVLAPFGPALLIRAFADEWEGPPAVAILWMLEIQLVVPLVSLLLGSAVVAEEIEDRTVTYLFTRPIPRASLLLGRWAAALVVALVLLCASAWVLLAVFDGAAAQSEPLAVAPGQRARLLGTILLGTTAYSLVFAAAGAIFKHPVIIGLGYTFAFEGFFANLPGSSQGITIQYWLKSFLMSGDASLQAQARELIAGSILASPEQALVRLLLIALVAALLGARVLTRKQYVLPS
jgi:ABC-type Na+ efflux pump permease subunit